MDNQTEESSWETSNLDEETKELMNKFSLDSFTAERVKDLMSAEGLDEDAAVELMEEQGY